MLKLLPILLYILVSQPAAGQERAFTIPETDSIVKKIDSTCIRGGITDYTFHKKGHRRKTIGGGADWFYTDSSGKKLLKVVRETSLESETFDTYYFYNDSLVYLTIINSTYTGDQRKVNGQGKFYFHNGQLLFKEDNLKFPFKPELYLRTVKEFFREGQIWRR